MKIDKAYIDWLQLNYPDSDHTKDLTKEYLTQESQEKFMVYCKNLDTTQKETTRNDDDYDEWRNNKYNWSNFSREVRS